MSEVLPSDLQTPSIESFFLIKDALFDLIENPFTRTRLNGNRLFFQAERRTIEQDLEGLECLCIFTGFLHTARSQNKILLRYRELPQTDLFSNSGFVHDYILRREDDEVVEFGQSINAVPGDLPMPSIESADIKASIWKQAEVEDGEKILRRELGFQLEIREGDMELLFDRIYEF